MSILWNWILPMLGACALSAVLLKIFIPVLRKAKLGQKILEIGPSWHKCKEGTPVLGGLFFLTAAATAFGVWCLIARKAPGHPAASVAVLALLSALIGFVDDYVKLFKKRNKGLSAKQKMVLQFVSVAVFLAYRYFFCKQDGVSPTSVRMFGLFGLDRLELSWFYFPIMLVLLVYLINCANLTDGIDGLEGSISWVHMLFFLLVVHVLIPAEENMPVAVLCAGLMGGLTGFLIFNFHPAKIFMGDTGSLFLGGFVTAVTVALDAELLLFPIAFVWIAEGVSVLLQVGWFKLTKKRLFRMAPIHHHFEKGGWSEYRIVFTFAAVTAVFCGLAFWAFTAV
ncbi:MAG: phospho-N-acetylmuramoyl-pentapeptide-transferase [Clostridia bacterium]|nr:phospho-N-acetylmuramoyl-pentapeptide-transferase [Clostridia bacterium]